MRQIKYKKELDRLLILIWFQCKCEVFNLLLVSWNLALNLQSHISHNGLMILTESY